MVRETTARTAKLFQNGGSQAVRLPVEYRFEGDEVFIRRDESTGDVTLSERPLRSQTYWQDLFAELDALRKPDEWDDEYMADRPMNRPMQDRDVFGNEQ
jgi:antitoxin VapB